MKIKDAVTVLDLRKAGILVTSDERSEVGHTINNGALEISSSINPKNVLRLRIVELTEDTLKIAISGKKGIEENEEFGSEVVELHYVPIPA